MSNRVTEMAVEILNSGLHQQLLKTSVLNGLFLDESSYQHYILA